MHTLPHALLQLSKECDFQGLGYTFLPFDKPCNFVLKAGNEGGWAGGSSRFSGVVRAVGAGAGEVYVFISGVYSLLLINISTFMPIPCYYDYYR